MSSADQAALRYVAESSYGVTPTDDDGWKELRFVSEDFSQNPQTAQAEEIQSHRQETDTSVVGLQVGGGFTFNLSMDTYDDFLEAVLGGTWTTDVLAIGNTERSFSFEKEFTDLSSEQFLSYIGMRCNAMELTFPWGGKVTGNFSFLGSGSDTPAASLVGLGSSAAATSTGVFDASAGLSSLKIAGSETSELVKQITLSFTNNMRPVEAVKQAAPSNVRFGNINCTGTLQVYHAGTASLYDLIQPNTSLALEWTITKDSETYTFKIPNAKLESGDPQATGRGSDVMPEYAFRGLYDATETALEITRST